MSEARVIIAIRMRQFGDVLATLGALEAIRRRWREARIVYVVDAQYHGVLAGVGFIDELVASPPRVTGPGALFAYAGYIRRLRAMRPWAVVDFHGNARSALVTRLCGARVRAGFDVRMRRRAYTVVETRGVVRDGAVVARTALEAALALVRRIGVDAGDTSALPEIGVDEALVHRARGRLVESGVPVRAFEEKRVIGLNPGRPYPAKAWPLDRFVALARALVAGGRYCVVLWGPGEEEAARKLVDEAGEGTVLAPACGLDDVSGLVKALAAIATIDSGLKHLAVCLRVPTVTLFGPTVPDEWHMGTRRDAAMWRGLSCSPCRRHECPFDTPCMDFSPRDVFDAVVGVTS